MASAWWRRVVRRAAPAGAIGCVIACQSVAPAPRPVAVGAPSEPAPQVETAAPEPRTAADLVRADGEVLLLADIDRARESPAYRAIKAVLEEKLPALARIREVCGLDLIDQTHDLAASADLARREPMIAARVDVSSDALHACAARAFSPSSEYGYDDQLSALAVDGHRAVRINVPDLGETWMMATDGWLLLGHPTELRRALERRKTPSRGPLYSFVRRRPHEVFAMVMDTTTEALGRATLSVVSDGGRLDALATITPNQEVLAAQQQDGAALETALGEARSMLTGLVDEHLSPTHPLADAARAMEWTSRGGTTIVRVAFSLPAELQPVLDRAVAIWVEGAATREMSDILKAVNRGAVGAFEREMATMNPSQAMHQLCGAALDVPAIVPRGDSYTPEAVAGRDYLTGDSLAGWRCLKFESSESQRFQLSYRVGGNYKGPTRGGPDPGPHGYEIAAEADLDGDGKTSLMTIHGVVDPKTHMLRRSSEVFVVDAGE